MVRQRKCHTRMRKSLSASGDGMSEGQATETKLEEGMLNYLLTAKHKNMFMFKVLMVKCVFFRPSP